jgi:excisionase family DNA binding protein
MGPQLRADLERRHGGRYTAERATYTVEEAGRKLGISRNSAYEAARSGQLPTIRIGRLLLVPKAALDRMLGA